MRKSNSVMLDLSFNFLWPHCQVNSYKHTDVSVEKVIIIINWLEKLISANSYYNLIACDSLLVVDHFSLGK